MEQKLGNDLLSWFGGDRKRLEEFRGRLIYWFEKQGCRSREDCEDNTQETFERTIEILARKPEISTIPPEQYITGVAKNILRESRKPIQFPTEPLDPETTCDPDPVDVLEELEREREQKCLGKCLQNLEPAEHELVGLYALSNSHYTEELTQKFGGTSNAIRIRIYRIIREKLRPCVEGCIKHQ